MTIDEHDPDTIQCLDELNEDWITLWRKVLEDVNK